MRGIAAVLAATLALGPVACGTDDGGGRSSQTTEAAPGSDGFLQTRREDVLTVGTRLPAPPFWIGDGYDSVEGGFEADLAREIADRLGIREVRFVEISPERLLTGRGWPADIVLSQVALDFELAAVVDLSIPYYTAGVGVLVREGTSVANLLEAAILRWGAQESTPAADYLATVIRPEAPPRLFVTTPEMFRALRDDEIDAVLADTPIVVTEAGADPDAGLEVAGRFDTGEQYAVALPKGSPNTEVVDTIIQELIDEGFVADLTAQYFGADTSGVPTIG